MPHKVIRPLESVHEIHNVFFFLVLNMKCVCSRNNPVYSSTDNAFSEESSFSFFLEKKQQQNNNNNRLTHISLTTCRSSDLLFSCRTTSSTCKLPQKSLIFRGLHAWRKGDVTRDDSQRRFFAQHSIAMLEQCCNHLN